MDKALSQREIDKLLSSISGGPGIEAKRDEATESGDCRAYDFRTANKFSKEQIRTLNNIFENYAFLFLTRLTGTLRTLCDAKVISIEEVTFSEFNNSMLSPSIIAIIDVQPFRGSILLAMAPALAYAIISRLFGGAANYVEATKKFTEIELTMLKNVINQMTDMFMESWDKVAKLDAKLQRIETSPQFTQIVDVNEPSVVITFNIKVDSVEDMIAFCIPHFAIQPLLKRLNTTFWTIGTTRLKNTQSQEAIISKSLLESKITIKAVFDSFQVPMQDLLLLKKGDVICMDHNINAYLTLVLEQIPKFKGVIGISNQKQVMQIAEIMKEREELE